mmetsp:Transcript_21419/g.52482  ORF Transcript_21419/g.52482 Transcript_21419/m.52482 type:complete len:266 (+) Transcript_21419:103-900(+)|eukprot:CAMPEP_0114510882 /NCGR_PEP_ID=MMETSP0109-20121206/14046_1 /TAXON_ID=29199 /ORGANISM="Chlorarachnion reptans, Strain CCCM449" /LENGTH=265 /DNA_ID=CAMNT_0001690263 /DNA_START=84 /DNA_END=881 /DNA_ORIENTATION=+
MASELAQEMLELASQHGKNSSITSKINRLLVDVDIEVRDRRYATALLRACEAQNKELVDFLVQKGANFEATDNLGWNAIHYLVSGIQTYGVRDEKNRSPALAIFETEKLKSLRDRPDNQGMTPFMLAVSQYPLQKPKRKEIHSRIEYDADEVEPVEPMFEVLKKFLEIGADPLRTNCMGDNAVAIAQNRNIYVVRSLLQSWAKYLKGAENLKNHLRKRADQNKKSEMKLENDTVIGLGARAGSLNGISAVPGNGNLSRLGSLANV